jgi:hypothetical protein
MMRIRSDLEPQHCYNQKDQDRIPDYKRIGDRENYQDANHWITDLDPYLFFSGFQDSNKNSAFSTFFAYYLL